MLGRVVEGIFRSLNNLLERFNRSYWFYLLSSTRRYISIGYYMIPLGLFALPLLLEALNIYLTSLQSDEQGGNSGKEKKSRGISYWSLISVVFFCHSFIPTLLPIILQKVPWLQTKFSLNSVDALYYSLVSFSLIMMFTPLIRISNLPGQRQAHKCVALLNLALLLACVGLFNISLAFFLTITYVPVVCLISADASGFIRKFGKLLSKLLLLLLHPLVLSWLMLYCNLVLADGLRIRNNRQLRESYLEHKRMVMMFVRDWYIFGNWSYLLATGFLFPVWLQFWYI